MTEELLVGWIDQLDRTCRELSRKVYRVRVREQQTAQECEERVRRAEARSDLLATAYSVASRDPEDHGANALGTTDRSHNNSLPRRVVRVRSCPRSSTRDLLVITGC
jgi:hypothetical protein